MYIVKGNGIVWDAKNNRPLVKFEGGKAEVEDEAVVEKLKKMGYSVDKAAKKKE